MAKINRTDIYPLDNNISMSDYLIGSDGDNYGKTKNFPISSIVEFIKNAIDLLGVNNKIFDLGDITGQNYLDVLNLVSNVNFPNGYPLTDKNKIYYIKFINEEVTYMYFFDEPNSVNSYGTYGVDGENLFSNTDLVLFYSFNNNVQIIDDSLFVHKAGIEIITGKKIFSADIEVKSINPEIKLQETINNQFLVFKCRDLGDGSLLIKNHNNKNLLLLTNPTGSYEPQLAIGNTDSIPPETQLYVYGGNSGANIDMRGKSSRDECNMDLEGNDWEIFPNSLGFSYFGNQHSLGGDILGYPKSRLGHIRFNEADYAIITSKNESVVVPIRFGINNEEISYISDKGWYYTSDYSSDNTENPRWIPDKEYVESLYGFYIPLSGTVENKPVTGSIQFGNSIVILNNNEGEDNVSTIGFEDGTAVIYCTNNTSSYSSSIRVSPSIVTVDSTDPSSRGLTGSYDYTDNIGDLDYIQKKYADNTFIPLSGTVEGKEISGSLQFKDAADFDYAIYASDLASNNYTQVISFNRTGLILTTFDDTYSTILQVYRDNIVIESTNPESAGLVGNSDFTNNATDLSFIQKKYVDQKVSEKFMEEIGTLSSGLNQKTIFFPNPFLLPPSFVNISLGGEVSDGIPIETDELYSHSIRGIYEDRVVINVMRLDSIGAASSHNIRAYVSVKL